MTRKFFFFDYDGTLAVPRTAIIPESTRRAVAQLQAAGHFVALATGRMQCNVADFAKNTGISNIVADGGYSVTLNGKLEWIDEEMTKIYPLGVLKDETKEGEQK